MVQDEGDNNGSRWRLLSDEWENQCRKRYWNETIIAISSWSMLSLHIHYSSEKFIWKYIFQKSEKLKNNGNQLFGERKYRQALWNYLEAMKYDESDYRIPMNLMIQNCLQSMFFQFHIQRQHHFTSTHIFRQLFIINYCVLQRPISKTLSCRT